MSNEDDGVNVRRCLYYANPAFSLVNYLSPRHYSSLQIFLECV